MFNFLSVHQRGPRYIQTCQVRTGTKVQSRCNPCKTFLVLPPQIDKTTKSTNKLKRVRLARRKSFQSAKKGLDGSGVPLGAEQELWRPHSSQVSIGRRRGQLRRLSGLLALLHAHGPAARAPGDDDAGMPDWSDACQIVYYVQCLSVIMAAYTVRPG